jgi:G:T-mismatch repair DNA endonuclease (very short patch repair protein)
LVSFSSDPDGIARRRREQRRRGEQAAAWWRHRRAAAAQAATGNPGRAYNKLEARLARLLEAGSVEYRWQFPLGRYVYDFLLPDKLLVEVHGTYWHADPRVYEGRTLTPDQRRNRLRDIDKKLFAAARGYRLKVVWETDLARRGVTLAGLLDGPEAGLSRIR